MTVIVLAGPGTTLTAAVPLHVPNVAVTVPLPGEVGATSWPELPMVPMVVCQVKTAPGMMLLYWSYAVAVKVLDPPAATVAGFGVTSTWSAAPTTTSMVAKPLFVPLAAVTKPLPGEVWAMKYPVALTEPTPVDQVKATPAMGLL